MAEVGRMEVPVPDRVQRAEPEHPPGEPEREREQEADPAGAERPHRRKHGAQHEDRARGEQGDRYDVRDAAEQEAQPDREPAADLPSAPPEIEDEREEGADGEHAESGEVEMPLLELDAACALARTGQHAGAACPRRSAPLGGSAA